MHTLIKRFFNLFAKQNCLEPSKIGHFLNLLLIFNAHSHSIFLKMILLSEYWIMRKTYNNVKINIETSKIGPSFDSLMLRSVICTGWPIKIRRHSFNHPCSHDRNTSNFKTIFIYYYTELSFEVYNSFLGQLA